MHTTLENDSTGQITTQPERNPSRTAAKLTARWIVFTFLLVAGASSAFAAEQGDMIFRFGVLYASPTGSTSAETSGREVFDDPSNPPLGTFDIAHKAESDPESATSANIGFEVMVSDAFGIDLNISSSRHDFNIVHSGEVTWTPMSDPDSHETAEIVGGQSGEIRMTPITVGVNYHLSAGDSVDLYFGPLIGYVSYGDVQMSAGEFQIEFSEFTSITPLDSATAGVKADWAFGAAVGIDVALAESWTFSASARYLESSVVVVDEGDAPPIDFDPLLAQIGVGYRF